MNNELKDRIDAVISYYYGELVTAKVLYNIEKDIDNLLTIYDVNNEDPNNIRIFHTALTSSIYIVNLDFEYIIRPS